jgi:hybrid cluster-associated redox disulfide protein
MIYYKTSQPVPGKGDAWMFYECNDDNTIRRYLTFIPATREIDKVAKPFIKKLQRPEMLMPAEKEEFEQYWPPGGGDQPSPQQVVSEYIKEQNIEGGTYFDPDMTIGEAMAVHPKVAEVFAAFHLGGCSSCGISEYETVGQVCMAYGVDLEVLLDVLESLMAEEQGEPVEAERADTQ